MLTASTHGVFTTGDVARLCQVAPRTVSKWFDSGRLRGYRVPGSQDRRIPREALLDFMLAHRIPLGELAERDAGRVLVIGVADADWETLCQELESVGLSARRAESPFGAGALAAEFRPDCVVIDSRLGPVKACLLRSLSALAGPRVRTIGIVSDEDEGSLLSETGFDDRFRRPFDAALLAARALTLTNALVVNR